MRSFVIGDDDMVTGFRLVGVEGVEVTSSQEASQALSKALKRNDIAIVVISEEFSLQIQQEIKEARLNKMAPLIVELPGHLGPTGKISMSDLVSKTLGIEV
jgi:V/A-type H+-transporting ATPase subunit F